MARRRLSGSEGPALLPMHRKSQAQMQRELEAYMKRHPCILDRARDAVHSHAGSKLYPLLVLVLLLYASHSCLSMATQMQLNKAWWAGGALLLADLLLFGQLVLVDPGSPASLTPEALQAPGQAGWTVCGRCHATRPPRCYHCQTCGQCVMLRDHHCVWLGRCVGAHNIHRFLLFLCYTLLLSLMGGTVFGCYFLANWSHVASAPVSRLSAATAAAAQSSSFPSSPPSSFSVLIAFLSHVLTLAIICFGASATAYLLARQSYMLSHNKTTLQLLGPALPSAAGPPGNGGGEMGGRQEVQGGVRGAVVESFASFNPEHSDPLSFDVWPSMQRRNLALQGRFLAPNLPLPAHHTPQAGQAGGAAGRQPIEAAGPVSPHFATPRRPLLPAFEKEAVVNEANPPSSVTPSTASRLSLPSSEAVDPTNSAAGNWAHMLGYEPGGDGGEVENSWTFWLWVWLPVPALLGPPAWARQRLRDWR